MKKSRFSEEQIIGMIKEQESRVKTADLCRKYGISPRRSPRGKVGTAGSM
jgi:putative transposase